jgi:hypothetical protein
MFVTIMPRAVRKLPCDSQQRVLIPTLGPVGRADALVSVSCVLKKDLAVVSKSVWDGLNHIAVPSSERSL